MAEEHERETRLHEPMREPAYKEAPKYEPGKMDITEQERTFEGFIRFWVILFGVAALILIFLAIFNS
jgi:hypothetical protein